MSPFHQQIENALRGPVAAILTKWGTSVSEAEGGAYAQPHVLHCLA